MIAFTALQALQGVGNSAGGGGGGGGGVNWHPTNFSPWLMFSLIMQKKHCFIVNESLFRN
jgi:hypothetical protein